MWAFVFMIALFCSFVVVADDDFDGEYLEGEYGDDELLEDDDSVDSGMTDDAGPDSDIASSGQSSEELGEGEWTNYFYIAMGFLVVGLLIVAYFIHSFLTRPKNRWRKKKAVGVVKK